MVVDKASKERTKVVLRHIPPGFTSESLLQLLESTLSPFPKYDFYHFAPADYSLAPYLSCRAYFNFVKSDSSIAFKDKFDGQKFIDCNKIQSVGIVEYAPFQRMPKRFKKDVRSGTLEKDSDFLEFLEELKIEPEAPPSIETIIDEIEKRRAARAEEQSSTALLEYIKTRRAERSLSPHNKPQYNRRDRPKLDDRDTVHRYKGSRARGRNTSEEEHPNEYRRKSHTDSHENEKPVDRERSAATASRRANDEFRSRNNVKSERSSKSFVSKGKPEKAIYVPGKKKIEEPAKYILGSSTAKESSNTNRDNKANKDSSNESGSKNYREKHGSNHCEERTSYRREGYDGDKKETKREDYRREGYDGDRKDREYRRDGHDTDKKDRDRDDRDNDYYDSYRGGYRGNSYRGSRGYSRGGGWRSDDRRDDRRGGRSTRSRGRSSRAHS